MRYSYFIFALYSVLWTMSAALGFPTWVPANQPVTSPSGDATSSPSAIPTSLSTDDILTDTPPPPPITPIDFFSSIRNLSTLRFKVMEQQISYLVCKRSPTVWHNFLSSARNDYCVSRFPADQANPGPIPPTRARTTSPERPAEPSPAHFWIKRGPCTHGEHCTTTWYSCAATFVDVVCGVLGGLLYSLVRLVFRLVLYSLGFSWRILVALSQLLRSSASAIRDSRLFARGAALEGTLRQLVRSVLAEFGIPVALVLATLVLNRVASFIPRRPRNPPAPTPETETPAFEGVEYVVRHSFELEVQALRYQATSLEFSGTFEVMAREHDSWLVVAGVSSQVEARLRDLEESRTHGQIMEVDYWLTRTTTVFRILQDRKGVRALVVDRCDKPETTCHGIHFDPPVFPEAHIERVKKTRRGKKKKEPRPTEEV